MLKKIVSGLSAAAMLATMVTAASVTVSADAANTNPAMEMVHDMGIGINLGNTFEATNGGTNNTETDWGSPKITQEMIEGYANAGFKTLRIPVAWHSQLNPDGEPVSQAQLDRVYEVVNWALDADLYVIINEHWDGGWINEIAQNDETWEAGVEQYKAIWTKVADKFKDCGDKLIFESQNEEFGNWKTGNDNFYLWNVYSQQETVPNGKQIAYDRCNEINQVFVDLIRSSGGNNDDRLLLISGFITDFDRTCDPLFEMPEDPANMSAVSVHYYTPVNFGLNDTKSWGTPAEYTELNNYMDMVKERFVDAGIPAIIGECCNGAQMGLKDEGDAVEYNKAVCSAAYARNMCPVLWDINYKESNKQNNIIYNRNKGEITFPGMQEALNDVVSKDRKVGSIEAPESLTVKYKDPNFKIEAKAAGDSSIGYSSSNEKVVKVSDTGEVTVVGSGTANIIMLSAENDEYTAATASTEITVEKLDEPPVKPDAEMIVGEDITSTAQIKLPSGWTWQKRVDLELDTPTEATAIYNDTNYKNRTAKVTITRKKNAVDDDTSSDSSSNADSSSTGDSSSNASSSSSSSSNNANNSNANNNNNNSTAAKDSNPATGSAVAASTLAAISLAGLLVVTKKKSKNN